MSERPPVEGAPRALVVEDDPDVAALLGSHLRRMGCRVTLAGSAEEGLRAANADPPQLAVVDILLPGMDGRRFLDLLGAGRATAACRTVATSILDPQDVGRPCDAVLPKPFGRRDIERVVGPLLVGLGGRRP